jgi:hypothetical protein
VVSFWCGSVDDQNRAGGINKRQQEGRQLDYTATDAHRLFATRPSILGKVRGVAEVPAKARHIKHNLSSDIDMPSRSVYEPIAKHVLCGGPSPICGRD